MNDALEPLFRTALAGLPGDLGLADAPPGYDPVGVAVEFQTPARPEHGDLATNVALHLAKPLGRPPRAVAEALAARLRPLLDPRHVAAVEVAGPGFLNLRFAPTWLTDGVADVLRQGEAYGRTDAGAGRRALVEYVSANPTGPLTVGHGRNAVLGDTFANLLDWTGHRVTREYYFNDAGRQMRILGESVRARYEALVRPDTPTRQIEVGGESVEVPERFPDDGYLGAYITEIARTLADAHGDALLAAEDEGPFKEAAQKAIFADIEATMTRLGVHMDTYFNEHTLYETGAVWDVVERLKARNLAYEKDGAVWFRTGALGKVQSDAEGERPVDTVLVKSSGEPTYRLPDIAYHLDKLARADVVLDVFGADHIATYPDVVRGVRALGGEAERISAVVYQFVTLVRGGEPVKMSTRKANYVTLDELMDEVGADVTRFFFLMRSPDTHLDFDLDLAKEASDKNPVFYLQYAHARICSILRKAGETGLTLGGASPDLGSLTHASEAALKKELLRLPAQIRLASDAKGPHRLAGYLREVAAAFSAFYRDCRIVGEPEPTASARLALAEATRLVLRNGLAVLGISAPERMDRD